MNLALGSGHKRWPLGLVSAPACGAVLSLSLEETHILPCDLQQLWRSKESSPPRADKHHVDLQVRAVCPNVLEFKVSAG